MSGCPTNRDLSVADSDGHRTPRLNSGSFRRRDKRCAKLPTVCIAHGLLGETLFTCLVACKQE
jgi:hypothetical protein